MTKWQLKIKKPPFRVAQQLKFIISKINISLS